LPGATGQMALDDSGWQPVRKSASFDIPLVPADRARESVIGEFSVKENLTLSVLRRFRRFGLVRSRSERQLADEWFGAIEVKAASPDDLITTLSGGNQQKVMMARCLARDPRVLVLCEPTAGVDVGTRQAIYEFIATRARAGLSLVVSSSDTGDLLALCTRVLVMCNGKVVREIAGDEITERALVHAMEETEQE
jgi:ABC-type sugar transport system ATPase subunit